MNVIDQKPLGPRAAQKAETARVVLAAARDEFERVGFEAANLRAIAASAGVSAGTVLHHFHDKRELLYAALFDGLSETFAAALKRPGPAPLERQLMGLTRAVFGFYEARPGLSRTLLKESLFAEGEWGERFGQQTAGVHATVVGWVQAAQQRGELDASVDAVFLTAAYLSFFYFGLLSWMQGAVTAPVPFVGRLLKQHLAGLSPAPRKKGRSP